MSSPPPSYGDTTAPPGDGQPVPTAPQSNTTTNTQTATATGGAGGSATGGNAGPSQGAGGGSHGGDAYANGGNAESHNSLDNQQSNQARGGDGRANAAGWGGDDDYAIESTKPRRAGRAAHRAKRARSSGHPSHRAPDRVTKGETSGRPHHGTDGASPNGRPPGHGGRLPDQNPFLSLLSAPGGAGAGLTLLLLAVLGAAIALPNRHFRAFRPPPVQWRPLAYVPPIELPG